MELKITDGNFEEEVKKSSIPVLVDFYADWCGPCKMMAPVLEELEKSRGDILVGKVDVDEQGALARQYSISAVPTLVLFKDGREVKRNSGFLPKEALERFIDEV